MFSLKITFGVSVGEGSLGATVALDVGIGQLVVAVGEGVVVEV